MDIFRIADREDGLPNDEIAWWKMVWHLVCLAVAAGLSADAALAAEAPSMETYRRLWNEVRPEIDAGIERNRKRDVTLGLADNEGLTTP